MTSFESEKYKKKDENNNYNIIPIEYNTLYKNKNFFKKNNNDNIKNRINNLKGYEIQNNSNLEEDDYNYLIYDKSITQNENFFFDQEDDYIYPRNKTISSFNSINKKLSQNYKTYFEDNNISINSEKRNLFINFSFKKNNSNNSLLNKHSLLINNEKNNNGKDNNIIKNINIFYPIHKKIIKILSNDNNFIDNKESIPKNLKINNNNNNISLTTKKNINLDSDNKKSKFSKKNKKFKKSNNDINKIHSKNLIQYEVNFFNHKNESFENQSLSNNICKNNLDFRYSILKKINCKMCDAFFINPYYQNNLIGEEKKTMLKKSPKNNKPLKKISVDLNYSHIDNKYNFNNSKIKNYFMNYINLKKQNSLNYKQFKTLIDDYSNRNDDDNNKLIHCARSKEEIGFNKIIKKKFIVEEEYMISPKGDETLLSVKKIENGGLDLNNHSHIIDKYFQKKNISQNSVFNNSLFSSIFKENSKDNNSLKKKYFKSIDGDITNISNNNSNYSQINNEKNKNISQNNIKSSSINKNKNINMVQNIFKKIGENIPIRKIDLNDEPINRQRINSELNYKELQSKKRIFHNKISLLKNKTNKKANKNIKNIPINDNIIRVHTNFINNNKTSLNYTEEKKRNIIYNSKIINDKISNNQKKSLLSYHNKEKTPNQNFIINNNQNCPNLVNIVFFNHEERNNVNNNGNINYNNTINKYSNNKKINIPFQIFSNRQKRNNYKFHEIKSVSIDISPGLKTVRNHNNFEINKYNYINNNNTSYDLKYKNSDTNIFSKVEKINNINKNKYYEISLSKSAKDEHKINNSKGKFNKRSNVNNNIGHYYTKFN